MHQSRRPALQPALATLIVLAGALTLGLAATVPPPASAQTQTRSVHLRVEGPSGALEPGRGYVAGTVRGRRAAGSGCNPRPAALRIAGPTPIGALGLAARHNDALRPQWMRPTDFGWQLCGIGSERGFGVGEGPNAGDFGGWLYRANNRPGTSAPDEVSLGLGDALLLHFAVFPGPGSDTPALNNGRELVIRRVPSRVRPGEAFEVRAVGFGFGSSPEPATGAEGIEIRGGDTPVETDENGFATVTVGEPGTSRIFAVQSDPIEGGFGPELDIPSERLAVCVDERLAQCPAERGTRILGSPRADRIRATRGDDVIRAGAGDDVIDLRPGGRNRVLCGAGGDRVIVNAGERGRNTLRNCERVVIR